MYTEYLLILVINNFLSEKITMKKFYIISFLISAVSLLIFSSCAEDPAPSLWDPPDEELPAPNITLIEPVDYALAGVSVITVTGENFSSNIEHNRISFDGQLGEILSASPTQLEVRVPLVVSDSVEVKVSRFGVEDFSNIYYYRMIPPVEEYYEFDPNNNEVPVAITFDQAGNLLVAMEGRGVFKVTPDRVLSEFIPKGSETKWDELRIFSNGDVYGSRTARGIWQMEEGVTPPNQPWALTPSGTFLRNFDFDINTNLWAVGGNNFIFRINQNQEVSMYDFAATLRAVRVFDNHLYVAGLQTGIEGVWKFAIDSNGDLGQPELYFDMTDAYPDARTNAMAVSQDGDLFLGTNNPQDPIITVHPDGSDEIFYPGVIEANDIVSMYWPEGNHLFITRTSAGGLTQTVLRIDTEKSGAVYYNN